MKKTLRFLTLGIAALIGITAYSMPTYAQDAAASPQSEECAKIYNEKFLVNRTKDQPQARKDAQEYLDKCKGKTGDEKIDTYVANWVIKYDWGKLLQDFEVAFKGNDFPNAYKYGREILAKTPEQMAELVKLKVATGTENISTTMKLGYLGYPAAQKKDTTYINDATNYAKQAIGMVEAGKAPAAWAPFKDKDDALAWLNFTLGYISKDSAPKDSAAYFYKTLSFNSSLKAESATYYHIASYYSSEYKKVNDMIKSKCENVPDNDECKALDEQQNAWVDRWADALARAVSLKPNEQAAKDSIKTLEQIFTIRYNIKDGDATSAVNEYLKNVQSKPIPDPTTKPEPAPVREVKQDATTTTTGTATQAKPVSTLTTSNTSTTDVAMNNGSGSDTKSGTAAKTATDSTNTATTTTPAKKAPAAKSKAKTKRPR